MFRRLIHKWFGTEYIVFYSGGKKSIRPVYKMTCSKEYCTSSCHYLMPRGYVRCSASNLVFIIHNAKWNKRLRSWEPYLCKAELHALYQGRSFTHHVMCRCSSLLGGETMENLEKKLCFPDLYLPIAQAEICKK